MIKHIFKLIWNERKINAWILIELIVVFCLFWFCVDYLYFISTRYFQSTGFDIEHTYSIRIATSDEGQSALKSEDKQARQDMLNDIWEIHDRIQKYPAVEYVSYSHNAFPYNGSWTGNVVKVDSASMNVQMKRVSPDFFKVFKINIIDGIPFTWENSINSKVAIISAGADGLFSEWLPEQIKQIGEEQDLTRVIGVAERNKFDEYREYTPLVYYPLRRDHYWTADYREICIRVKPEADSNFEETFRKDMNSRLRVGHYYLAGITSIKDIRARYMAEADESSNLKSISSVSTFLIVNIFLGIIGTFWFRIQSRRSEVGLRMALGSTKSRIKSIFISETFILLLTASIVATIICVNISMGDLLQQISIPVPERGKSVAVSQYIINYGITFAFLLFISVLAVWYPANRASKIAPAEALRDE